MARREGEDEGRGRQRRAQPRPYFLALGERMAVIVRPSILARISTMPMSWIAC